jgi:acetyl-CoA carboxylase carboxyl transferase subunit beta
VIRETTHQDLPAGFQTAEFLEERGLIDRIVHRKDLRSMLASALTYLTPATSR